jgi:aminopeptidase
MLRRTAVATFDCIVNLTVTKIVDNSSRLLNRMASTNVSRKGLVLGAYTDLSESGNSTEKGAEKKEKEETPFTVENLTKLAKAFNEKTKGALLQQLNCTEPLKAGKHRVLYSLDTEYSAVAIVGLGKRGAGFDAQELLHQGREQVRVAAGAGVGALRNVGVKSVNVDPCAYPDAAAEGALLSLHAYDDLKSKEDSKKPKMDLNVLKGGDDDANVDDLWRRGTILAEAQNMMRRLQEIPANLLTPIKFGEFASEKLKGLKNVEVIVRDKKWATEKKMYSFLSVAQGSDQPPTFVEIHLKSSSSSKSDKGPLVLVGKGVCFDSGGISIKPSANMDKMRSDMGGAACVVSAIYALSRLGSDLPFDVIGLTPMVENMPGGKATKPGDVFYAMNGKSIKVDNTDAEGRLILADALCYADTFKPAHVIDLATLTGAMHIALGAGAAGVFTNCEQLWKKLYEASIETGDRVWRMPLWKTYGSKLKTESADLNNIALGAGGGSSIAAAFLKEFTECNSWAHIDIAGVAGLIAGDEEISYIGRGMSGRPVRTLVKCVENL